MIQDEEQWHNILNLGIWSYNRTAKHFFPLRMFAIRLNDQSIAVLSPLKNPSTSCLESLNSLGPVSFIIAPNFYHNLGIAGFLSKYPKATLLAGKEGIKRLQKVTGFQFEPIDRLTALLPKNIEIIEPPGLKSGELFLIARSSQLTLWCVADAYFNIQRLPASPFSLALILGGTAPGLRLSRVFRMIAIKDATSYFEWLRRRIASDQPGMLVPCHGQAIQNHDLPLLLAELVP